MIDKPYYMSVPTLRNYEEYHDAEQYTKGWNDAMDFIFPEAKRERELKSIKKNFKVQDVESADRESEVSEK